MNVCFWGSKHMRLQHVFSTFKLLILTCKAAWFHVICENAKSMAWKVVDYKTRIIPIHTKIGEV